MKAPEQITKVGLQIQNLNCGGLQIRRNWKKIIFVVFYIVACNLLLAQKNDEYRLKALDFFCANKNDIVRINHTELGDYEPVFFLHGHFDKDESGHIVRFHIDSNDFTMDTSFIEDMVGRVTDKEIILNNDGPKSLSDIYNKNVLCNYYGCIFLYEEILDCNFAEENRYSCKRECKLAVSKVVTYQRHKFVMLRIIGYFLGKAQRMQFCLMEFSNNGELQRCLIGDEWWVD